MAKSCREYDFIGRYGGEEFIICLPNTSIVQANVIAACLEINVVFESELPIYIDLYLEGYLWIKNTLFFL